jgi:hypothetical protein
MFISHIVTFILHLVKCFLHIGVNFNKIPRKNFEFTNQIKKRLDYLMSNSRFSVILQIRSKSRFVTPS